MCKSHKSNGFKKMKASWSGPQLRRYVSAEEQVVGVI